MECLLCVVHVLEEYLARTEKIRKSSKLFVSLVKPHKEVTKQTISRWLKCILEKAGIDVKKFCCHSTRGASVSKAKAKNVPIDEILKVGGWKRQSTFTQFYDIKIQNKITYSETLLKL